MMATRIPTTANREPLRRAGSMADWISCRTASTWLPCRVRSDCSCCCPSRDFLGLVITNADVADFVCQARKYAAYHDGDVVQTHWWGPGGDQSVRAYLKREEIAVTGRGGYLLGPWAAAGDDGVSPVSRVESQTRRRVLRQLGVATAEEAVCRAGEVYVYATGRWLRWVDPTTATRAVRAEVDQRWGIVQRAAIAAGASMPRRASTERHAPALNRLVPMINGLLTSAGAALGVDDPDAVIRQVAMLASGYRDEVVSNRRCK